MKKYVSRLIDKLPVCIRSYVRNVALSKTDDFVKIVRRSGYEIWVWALDLAVDICIIK